MGGICTLNRRSATPPGLMAEASQRSGAFPNMSSPLSEGIRGVGGGGGGGSTSSLLMSSERRSDLERAKQPDRINLDRRGLHGKSYRYYKNISIFTSINLC
jgi:hypothetical protein